MNSQVKLIKQKTLLWKGGLCVISRAFVCDLSLQVGWKPLKWHLDHITLNTSIQTHANEVLLYSSNPLIMKPKSFIIRIITPVAPSNRLITEEPFLVRDTGLDVSMTELHLVAWLRIVWVGLCEESSVIVVDGAGEISYWWVQVERGQEQSTSL